MLTLRFVLQPRMLKQTWSDQEIRSEYVPSVLQTVRKGHRFRQGKEKSNSVLNQI